MAVSTGRFTLSASHFATVSKSAVPPIAFFSLSLTTLCATNLLFFSLSILLFASDVPIEQTVKHVFHCEATEVKRSSDKMQYIPVYKELAPDRAAVDGPKTL